MQEASQVTDESLREVEKKLAGEIYTKIEAFGVNEFVNLDACDVSPITSESQDADRKHFFDTFDSISLPFSPNW